MSTHEDQEMDPSDAVAYVRGQHEKICTEAQLAKLRSRGVGPAYVKRDGRVLYTKGALDAWAETARPRIFRGPCASAPRAAA